MIIKLKDCIEHMSDEEKDVYHNENANDYFSYLKNSSSFKIAFEKLEEDDWIYLFEKFYLITYKAMSEETSIKSHDGFFYLFSKLGMLLHEKGSSTYNSYYRVSQIIKSYYYDRRINDDLLKTLEDTMISHDEEDLMILLSQHEEASRFRNYRNSMYYEVHNSEPGNLTPEIMKAIDCLNNSYEKEKKLVLRYKR